MLKYVLLATSVAIASPAFAQDAPASETTAPAPAEAPAPAQTAPEAEPAQPAQDATGMPESAPPSAQTAEQPAPTEPAAPAQAPAETAAVTEPAPAQPATDQTQVAQVVNTEFATYDVDKDGVLNKAEFDTWMNTLRKAAEPGYVAESPAGKTWLTQAFTQADTDKNAKINAVELTAFLTPKPAS
ncbi:hypothetical protein P1X14_15380 [Sphingomonas sp. AOB5]|uniref:hypothetical protein n=1 Tax=Sphingomonas sp. AOB5 TaxID=3034017 RepID=UPI0023F7F7C1|nr:hypothetical protein [Sphingomonas sp. AOB5]MDF7776638.1 hypothetical protein [Sphingomonas sp. AOB5]